MDNVITLSKLIGLLFLFCPPTSLFDFENSKNTRNELARPVMGTIFLVVMFSCNYTFLVTTLQWSSIRKGGAFHNIFSAIVSFNKPKSANYFLLSYTVPSNNHNNPLS